MQININADGLLQHHFVNRSSNQIEWSSSAVIIRAVLIEKYCKLATHTTIKVQENSDKSQLSLGVALTSHEDKIKLIQWKLTQKQDSTMYPITYNQKIEGQLQNWNSYMFQSHQAPTP